MSSSRRRKRCGKSGHERIVERLKTANHPLAPACEEMLQIEPYWRIAEWAANEGKGEIERSALGHIVGHLKHILEITEQGEQL